uniref:NADH-ubiquinone oxidoreductase chain 2 n=1 Tax=Lomis hirta TaxID=177234 RepID=A0A3Q8B8M5_9EUCA|nr:NADH dehydrogenase subunit 2 [Lomis hirta]
MYFSSLNVLFFSTLTTGMLLTISSSSWFGIWAGLELNLLSFIPLIVSTNNKYSSEAALKYFLIQALGSSFIIFSGTALLFSLTLPSIVLSCSLLLKLGAAPFHFWFPQIMEGLMWPQLIILMTMQKIAPLFLLSYLSPSDTIFLIIIVSIILSCLVGSILGMNQTSLRKIMAFSSINHIAWMLTASAISENMLLLYIFFYCIISTSVALLFHSYQMFYFNHLFNQTELTNTTKMLLFMSLLSLGGLPPFSGFIPKWFLIQELMSAKLFLLLIFLLTTALVTLYFYLRIAVSFFTLSSPKMKQNLMMTVLSPSVTSMLMFTNLFGLLVPSLIICF